MNDTELETVLSTVCESLEYTHPTAVIKQNKQGACDFRVATIKDSSIIIQAYQPYTITDEDINHIVSNCSEISKERMVRYTEKETRDGDRDGIVWFSITQKPTKQTH